MADSNLNNDPNQNNILASVNALFGALRGVLVPRRADGVAADGAADLGTAEKAWDKLFVKRLIIGGAQVDIAALAVGAPAYVFTASNPNFVWPGSQTRCLCLLWSGGSGGNGGSRAPNLAPPGDGGATTVTHGATTVSTGRVQTANAQVGSQAYTGAVVPYLARLNEAVRGAGGKGGLGTSTTGVNDGLPGIQNKQYFLLTGMAKGDTLNIQIGAGGAGTTTSSRHPRTTDGGDGAPGLAILFALD